MCFFVVDDFVDIPSLRVESWQLMLGYLPLNEEIRAKTLERKRVAYLELVEKYFSEESSSERSDYEKESYKLILKDVPRTMPDYPLFSTEMLKDALTHILYIWTIRHPASGYVQGINDLCIPFLIIFLSEHLDINLEDLECDENELGKLKESGILLQIEADCYYALSQIIDGIQDVYTNFQPGMQKMIEKMKEIVKRVDRKLYDHLHEQDIDFLQFAFRWINCFLTREFTVKSIIRMWDTYIAEENGFAVFHVYVCAALLLTWAKDLVQMDFQNLMLFLQKLPTQKWDNDEIDILLAHAYQYKTLFHYSPSHFKS
jgi:TBC1 domain family member 2